LNLIRCNSQWLIVVVVGDNVVVVVEEAPVVVPVVDNGTVVDGIAVVAGDVVPVDALVVVISTHAIKPMVTYK
jgi:hypothetical protein